MMIILRSYAHTDEWPHRSFGLSSSLVPFAAFAFAAEFVEAVSPQELMNDCMFVHTKLLVESLSIILLLFLK